MWELRLIEQRELRTTQMERDDPEEGRDADTVFQVPKHASDASVQIAAEATILAALSKAIGIPFTQGVTLPVGAAHVRPDGVAADESVFVEVFAHIGKLKGGQRPTIASRRTAVCFIRPNSSAA